MLKILTLVTAGVRVHPMVSARGDTSITRFNFEDWR